MRFSCRRICVLTLAAVIGVPSTTPGQSEADPLLIESRAVVNEFAQTLQAALQAAMNEGGPAAAINVCKVEAIEIASELSRTHGAKVSRTSLKTRNAMNLPEPWQAEVLQNFAIELEANGNQTSPAEYFSAESGTPARYMRAIRTGGLCLVCHGMTLQPAVAELLENEYPFDLARGYDAGDLRGAFSVVWPATPGADTSADP